MSFETLHWGLSKEDRNAEAFLEALGEFRHHDVKQKKWDLRYLSLTKTVAQWSEDKATKVGAVIASPQSVVSLGYNGFPRNVEHLDSRQGRPIKYDYFEHAERNALYNALGNNASIDVLCTLYLSTMPHPCPDCARAIIQCGIVRVVGSYFRPDGSPSFSDSIHPSTRSMFEEANVEVIYYGVEDDPHYVVGMGA